MNCERLKGSNLVRLLTQSYPSCSLSMFDICQVLRSRSDSYPFRSIRLRRNRARDSVRRGREARDVLASLALIILYHAIIYISVFGNWEAHLIADDYRRAFRSISLL